MLSKGAQRVTKVGRPRIFSAHPSDFFNCRLYINCRDIFSPVNTNLRSKAHLRSPNIVGHTFASFHYGYPKNTLILTFFYFSEKIKTSLRNIFDMLWNTIWLIVFNSYQGGSILFLHKKVVKCFRVSINFATFLDKKLSPKILS